ncbi:hypothetical protein KRR40_36290 [Niabella defluvii]|nr:hypothetical protein KRR40_36290 [Niabella sp. I65]
MKMNIYNSLLEKKKNVQKSFVVLIDPDGVTASSLEKLIRLSLKTRVDYFLLVVVWLFPIT